MTPDEAALVTRLRWQTTDNPAGADAHEAADLIEQLRERLAAAEADADRLAEAIASHGWAMDDVCRNARRLHGEAVTRRSQP